MTKKEMDIFKFDTPYPLRDYQLEGVNFLFKNNNILLADEMGLGKTVQVAVTLNILCEEMPSFKSLIVVPSSLKINWFNELQFWGKSLVVRKTTGGKGDRNIIINMPVNASIVSYEDVRIQYKDRSFDEKYNLIVFDEAQRIKNRGATAYLACKALNSDRIWALTGTPIENSRDDLISIFDIVEYGLIADYMAKVTIHEKIKYHFLRRIKTEVLSEIPPIIEQEMSLEMRPNQQTSYNNVLFSKANEIHYGMNSISLFSIINALKQICNYDKYSNESIKLDTLEVILSDAFESNKKVIIFSQYVKTLELIQERIKYNSVIYSGKLSEKNKDTVLNNFKNNTEINILLMSLKAGAVGLNIQEADLVIIFDRWWNPQIENQAVNRAHRFGRNTNLHVIYFTVMNSIEERISQILSEKREIFNEYIEQAESFKDLHIKDKIIEYLLKFKDEK